MQLLYDIVGIELADWFMWMDEYELEDGVRVHAYKHIYTRRYFHVAADGRAFEYIADGVYREINRLRAIDHVFERWEQCTDDPDDIAEVCRGLRKARRRAAPRAAAPSDAA